jgi:segregation and condensation protein B
MPDNQQSPELSLAAKLEALLFVAPEPVSMSQLASLLEISSGEIKAGLEELRQLCQTRGVRVQTHRGKVQLVSAPELTELIERFLQLDTNTQLSRAALETLAIIAYQQPITRPQIDAIRGVNSDGVIKNLLAKGLIRDLGRAAGPGRPILFGTTPDFLRYFGLTSLEELPALELEES